MVAHTIFFWFANQGASTASSLVDGTETPTNIFLSNIAGSLSILCWFIVFTPQFWINYKRQSGESLSLVFLYIWLAGDIMNLVGAIMENLLLTMRILAWYYTIADMALIAQIFYYRRTSVKASFESVITHASPDSLTHSPAPAQGENAPLIAGSSSNNYSSVSASEHVHETEHDRVIHQAAMVANATAAATAHHDDRAHTGGAILGYGHHQRRPSTHSTMTSASGRYRSKVARRRKIVRKALLIIFPIVSIAFLIWAYQDWLQCTIGHGEDSEEGTHCGRGNGGGHGKLPPSPSRPPTGEDDLISVIMGGKKHKKHSPEDDKTGFYYTVLPLLLGWGSAVLYLGSRIPQIYKNWRLKSCEGLSIMMFMFSVLGNILYVASIFLNSLEIDYLIKNMPWWLGSGGTLIFDFTIFFQFYIYRHNQPLTEALKEAAATGELDENALLATAESDEEEANSEESDSSSSTLNQNKNSSADAAARV